MGPESVAGESKTCNCSL